MTKTEEITNLDAAINLYPEFTDFLSNLDTKFKEVQNKLNNANNEGTKLEYYKWLDFDYLEKINQETIKLASQIKKQNYKHAIVMGMGGSGINSLVLKNALYEFTPKAIRKSNIDLQIQNNLDPSSMLSKLESLDLRSTLFIIISKSGSTDEVKRNITTLLDYLKAKGYSNPNEVLARQSVYITEPESPKNFLHILRAELESKTGIKASYLENDPNIGGRFSMFSPVGMFSAELMGLSSVALLKGARKIFENFKFAKSIGACSLAKIAAFDIFLSRRGIHNRYSMVYSDSLEALNKFRAQLKGESLNKNGIDSTVHIPGIGTVNHHSDLELLLKTNNGVLLEQVFFARPVADHVNQESLECLNDLRGQSNHQSLVDNHINPLYQYILENKAPAIQSIIPAQDEESIAEFCMQDMLSTIVEAGLQDDLGSTAKLDLAIRQWEVEKYKKSIRDKK